jgi:hypothetical protein
MSENLFSRRFWIGEADARLLALYRLLLGGLLLYDALDRLRDFHAFYTERGVLPRAIASAVRAPWAWSLFDMIQPWGLELALYLGGVACLAAFAVGYRTRLAGILSYVFLVSIQHRNDLVLDGSDVVLRVMLFWMLFADGGACWSLDVQLGRRPALARVPAHALGFLRVQVALVYLFTTVDKWHGGWWTGNYLYQVAQSYDFVRWLGPQLVHFPRLCQVMTRSVLILEGAIPILLLSPIAVRACRTLGLLCNLGLQGGIFLTMAVGNFPATMITASSLFLLPSWLDRMAVGRSSETPSKPRRRGLWLGVPLLALVFVSVLSYSFKLDYAQRFDEQLAVAGLDQQWPMFAQGLPFQGHWYAIGELQNHQEIEVFAEVAPGLLTSRAPNRYSRWYKFRFGLGAQHDYLVYDALGRYLCRRYNGRPTGPFLSSLEIQYWDERVPGPGEEPPKPVRVDMYRTQCIEVPHDAERFMRYGPAVSPPRP